MNSVSWYAARRSFHEQPVFDEGTFEFRLLHRKVYRVQLAGKVLCVQQLFVTLCSVGF